MPCAVALSCAFISETALEISDQEEGAQTQPCCWAGRCSDGATLGRGSWPWQGPLRPALLLPGALDAICSFLGKANSVYRSIVLSCSPCPSPPYCCTK